MYRSSKEVQPALTEDLEKTQKTISYLILKTKFEDKFLQGNDPKSKIVIFSCPPITLAEATADDCRHLVLKLNDSEKKIPA